MSISGNFCKIEMCIVNATDLRPATRGIMTGYDLRMSREPLIYAPADSKYKQLSQLFFAQDKLLINVSYVHALDLRLRPGRGIWAGDQCGERLGGGGSDAGRGEQENQGLRHSACLYSNAHTNIGKALDQEFEK